MKEFIAFGKHNMAYTLKENALKDGSIEDNYQYLFRERNTTKTRYIRDHLETLKEYAEKCDTVTEMGVDAVNSTWAFLITRPQKLTSIDISNNKAPEILALAEQLAKKEGINFEFIIGDTREIEIEPTDFLFIDTEHTYDQLKRELEIHPDKVRKYIAFHDTAKFPKMTVALNEFLKEHNEWKKVYETKKSCGLTVITRIK